MSNENIKRINPLQAAALLKDNKRARLIDVRSKVEFDYVGHPVDALHIAWKEYPDWAENPDFSEAVGAALASAGHTDKNQAVLLICRSGVRSMSAAHRLAAAGYSELYNVEQGFEGDKDENEHRGKVNGWRYHGLPWVQG